MRTKLAIVASHVVPYHVPLFQELSRCPGLDVQVFYQWDTRQTGITDPDMGWLQWDIDLHSGYAYEYLPNLSPRPRFSLLGEINPAIAARLWTGEFDAVLIFGYTTVTAWIARVTAALAGAAVLFKGESDLLARRSPLKRLLKSIIVGAFFKGVKGFLFSYSLNRKYFEHYGARPEALIPVPCAVDNAYWRSASQSADRAAARGRMGIHDGETAILFVGRLHGRKRPMDLLESVARLDGEARTSLIFAGDGPLAPELRRKAEALGLGSRVKFLGFRNTREMPEVYAAADLFVLPSELDPSPKALNEAMACALPVIVSDQVGTAADLVQDGRNGFLFQTGSSDDLDSKLRSALDRGAEGLRAMGAVSSEIVEDWSFESGADAISEFLRTRVAAA